jgi:hypothetical protein
VETLTKQNGVRLLGKLRGEPTEQLVSARLIRFNLENIFSYGQLKSHYHLFKAVQNKLEEYLEVISFKLRRRYLLHSITNLNT